MPDELSIAAITVGTLAAIFLWAFVADRISVRRSRALAMRNAAEAGRAGKSGSPGRCAVICMGALALFAASARATTLSFSGNLRTDANYTSCGFGCTLGAGNSDADYAQYAAVVDSFTLTSASAVQAVSFSYGGGVNGAGTTIAGSGLEPYLSLFDSAGDFLSSTYFGVTCPAGAQTNSVLGGCYDVLLDAGTLVAGTYEIALTDYGNLSFAENYGAGTLADGFIGFGSLQPGEDLHYAFDVDITPDAPPASPVPEPCSAVLMGSAGMIAVAVRRLRLRKGF